jgi:hypothetical protein
MIDAFYLDKLSIVFSSIYCLHSLPETRLLSSTVQGTLLLPPSNLGQTRYSSRSQGTKLDSLTGEAFTTRALVSGLQLATSLNLGNASDGSIHLCMQDGLGWLKGLCKVQAMP